MSHSTTCATLVRNGPCTCPPAPLQVRARGRLVLFCPSCDKAVRIWPYGTHATVAILVAAEQKHLEDVHSQQLDLSGLHDHVYEGGE